MTEQHGLRIGVLGTGWGTRISVPALRAEGWHVAALWSRHAERAEKQAAELEIPFATNDASALVDRPDIDAVTIVTPTPTHHDLCLQALTAGKHVLSEKPMAMHAGEAEAMAAAAESAGLTAMINFEFRFTPQRLHVQRLLADGYLGRLWHGMVELYWAPPLAKRELNWRSQAAMGGGVLNEHGSHYIDALHQWLGDIRSVSARTETFVPQRRGSGAEADADDFFTATFDMAQGGVVVLTQSWAASFAQGMRATLAGSDGMLVTACRETMMFDGEVCGAPTGSDDLKRIPRPPDFPPLQEPDWRVGSSRRLLREFLRGIREGCSPAPNFTDGLRCQRVIDAIRESARSERTVML
jgi:predicted dehydrogenase